MPKSPTPKQIDTLKHDAASRINVPTAEMASLYEQQAEITGDGERVIKVPRSYPLPRGEARERDPDRDPQIVWNGVKISITPDQMRRLAETGEIEIGDAQLVWRGKDRADWSDLVVNAPPIYVQEKVHPKAIIDDLKRRSDAAREAESDAPDLFGDFNGLVDPEARAEFYQHSMHWQNRMILGDSLQVMASLAEREALRGKVQCIYFDPPYGIKFNSNWQVSTLTRDVKDGKAADITREPEQVKAFRDTWKDGIHSYLTYLRDRLTVARELLTESGSIFVQISDENVHRVRAIMDEVFGEENFSALITFRKKMMPLGSDVAEGVSDYLVWYCKNRKSIKSRPLFYFKKAEGEGLWSSAIACDGRRITLTSEQRADHSKLPPGAAVYQAISLLPAQYRKNQDFRFEFEGRLWDPPKKNSWKTDRRGMNALLKANRLHPSGSNLRQILRHDDYPVGRITNLWADASGATQQTYVVQTNETVVQRCILMTTDPGDLVLDPTCGSGTTATVAEQWGRRWITMDTSRVALALARTRLMSARYPYYLLADSADGRAKEQDVSGKIQPQTPAHSDIRQGFVYERAPHITLKSIANNAEIDVIWEKWQAVLEPLRKELNEALGLTGEAGKDDRPSAGQAAPAEASAQPTAASAKKTFEEWEIPRDLDAWLEAAGEDTQSAKGGKRDRASAGQAAPAEGSEESGRTAVSEKARQAHSAWWEARIARQKEIDDSIAKAADVEMLYDRPYEDKSKVRVAGPFTVESLSPHRVVTARDDTLGEDLNAAEGGMQRGPASQQDVDFGAMVLDHLRTAGVQQQAKADTIHFHSVDPWPGEWLSAEGRYTDGDGREKRAGILIGPEFGTLTRSQITAAAREASDARFDALIACAFNFAAQASDLTRLGPLPILKARMNPDLHMAEDLKNTGKGNLFVVFGEPDVDLIETAEGELQVEVNGVDIFDPATGEIRSDGVDGIAAWFIDTDYDEESFFVRHAYFLGSAKSGGSDPYKALKTALKAEIDRDAWETLYSDTSRPFPRPKTGRIAVKVINHFGDEVLKVFGV